MVKSRGVLQLVIEVPLENADAALATLGGVPQPAAERWVGVAPLREKPSAAVPEPAPEPPAEPAKVTRLHERQPWSTLSRAQQAGILCQDPDFMAWRNERYSPAVTDAEGLASSIRDLCGVTSRRELDTDARAGRRWDRLVEAFRARDMEARYADARR
jgi:hypothetical protein